MKSTTEIDAVAYGIGYRHGYYNWTSPIAGFNLRRYDHDLAFRTAYDLGFEDGVYSCKPRFSEAK